MKTTAILSWTLASFASFSVAGCSKAQDIVVDEAPDHVRPYVLPRYKGRATYLTSSQIIRYSITANSSGGIFSLVQHK